jgi:opacity protein-like surface antigen
VLAALALSGSAAHAEGFVDLRAGASFTPENDVELHAGRASLAFESEFDESATVGGRGGYWFESLPVVGLALDVSYFAPDAKGGGPDLDVIPISPLLMLRAPLGSDEEYPNGRFQPFAGIGPGIFVTLLDDGSGYSDEPVDVGFDLHAGVRALLTPAVGLFVEYRFTTFEAQATDDFAGVSLHTDILLDTHHVAGGIGFSF